MMLSLTAAYYGVRPLGRLHFFLLSIPLGLISQIADVIDYERVSWQLAMVGLTFLQLALASLRRNRALDLGWGSVGMVFAVVPPILLLLTSFMEGFTRVNDAQHAPWLLANGVVLITMYVTAIMLLFAPGEQARATKASKLQAAVA
jgi:hypothetical protein